MPRSWTLNVMAGCVLVSTFTWVGAPLARAEDPGESRGAPPGYVAASAALTVAHAPLKAALCGVSLVLGSLAYVLSFGHPTVAPDVSDTVKGVCGGPYVITPARLQAAGE